MGDDVNAILTCSRCGAKVDKGAPAQPGQDDSQFVCGPCQDKIDAAAVAAQAPPIVLSGNG